MIKNKTKFTKIKTKQNNISRLFGNSAINIINNLTDNSLNCNQDAFTQGLKAGLSAAIAVPDFKNTLINGLNPELNNIEKLLEEYRNAKEIYKSSYDDIEVFFKDFIKIDFFKESDSICKIMNIIREHHVNNDDNQFIENITKFLDHKNISAEQQSLISNYLDKICLLINLYILIFDKISIADHIYNALLQKNKYSKEIFYDNKRLLIDKLVNNKEAFNIYNDKILPLKLKKTLLADSINNNNQVFFKLLIENNDFKNIIEEQDFDNMMMPLSNSYISNNFVINLLYIALKKDYDLSRNNSQSPISFSFFSELEKQELHLITFNNASVLTIPTQTKNKDFVANSVNIKNIDFLLAIIAQKIFVEKHTPNYNLEFYSYLFNKIDLSYYSSKDNFFKIFAPLFLMNNWRIVNNILQKIQINNPDLFKGDDLEKYLSLVFVDTINRFKDYYTQHKTKIHLLYKLFINSAYYTIPDKVTINSLFIVALANDHLDITLTYLKKIEKENKDKDIYKILYNSFINASFPALSSVKDFKISLSNLINSQELTKLSPQIYRNLIKIFYMLRLTNEIYLIIDKILELNPENILPYFKGNYVNDDVLGYIISNYDIFILEKIISVPILKNTISNSIDSSMLNVDNNEIINNINNYMQQNNHYKVMLSLIFNIQIIKTNKEILDKMLSDCILYKCNINIIKYLVEHGADLHQISKGPEKCSLLHRAALNGDLQIIQYLIDQKININVQDAHSLSPIFYSITKNNSEAINLFIKNKANLLLKDADNNNIIYYLLIFSENSPLINQIIESQPDLKNNKNIDDDDIFNSLLKYYILNNQDLNITQKEKHKNLIHNNIAFLIQNNFPLDMEKLFNDNNIEELKLLLSVASNFNDQNCSKQFKKIICSKFYQVIGKDFKSLDNKSTNDQEDFNLIVQNANIEKNIITFLDKYLLLKKQIINREKEDIVDKVENKLNNNTQLNNIDSNIQTPSPKERNKKQNYLNDIKGSPKQKLLYIKKCNLPNSLKESFIDFYNNNDKKIETKHKETLDKFNQKLNHLLMVDHLVKELQNLKYNDLFIENFKEISTHRGIKEKDLIQAYNNFIQYNKYLLKLEQKGFDSTYEIFEDFKKSINENYNKNDIIKEEYQFLKGFMAEINPYKYQEKIKKEKAFKEQKLILRF